MICALPGGGAHAGGVNDNRLELFDGLPSLGRGYNIHRNTLHSVCFESVKAPDPVFDFYYDFDKVDADFIRRLGGERNWAVDGELLDFVQDHVSGDAAGKDPAASSQVNIIARITLESYHATLDESGSPVGKSARALVEEGRFTAFFNACGFFYVRSLRYSSTFMALFQFKQVSGEEDTQLERLLRTGLFELGAGARSEEMEQLAAALELKIFVRGAGLGRASKLANLVPTNLREFRQSIEAAAELMQAASSGRITSMDVAPWIEHPDLRSAFFGKAAAAGESTFGRTQYMELNSQVITAINQARSRWLEQYYLASLCRNTLHTYYPVEKSEFSGQFDTIYDPQRTLFENHHHPTEVGRRITLQQFREYFEKYPPTTFLQRAEKFMSGSEGREGAEACVNALLKAGLDRADFTKLPSCVAAMNGVDVQERFLRNYCLPTPVTRVYRTTSP